MTKHCQFLSIAAAGLSLFAFGMLTHWSPLTYFNPGRFMEPIDSPVATQSAPLTASQSAPPSRVN